MSAAGASKTATYGAQEVQVCHDYVDFQTSSLISSTAVTVVIVAINVIIKSTTIWLIQRIGYDTHSEQITKIVNAVFVGQFFNTAILILLVYSNFGEIGLPLANFFNGTFYDYQDNWYALVGYKIVQTMLINALMPLGLELMPIMTKWLF